MIISASRRTDIPAFYAEWFMNRLKEGYCLTPNPFNPGQVARIPLLPESVDAIVFWSKNPAPLLPFLPKIEDMGYRFYVLFTVNGYPKALEPSLPPLSDRISAFTASTPGSSANSGVSLSRPQKTRGSANTAAAP